MKLHVTFQTIVGVFNIINIGQYKLLNDICCKLKIHLIKNYLFFPYISTSKINKSEICLKMAHTNPP